MMGERLADAERVGYLLQSAIARRQELYHAQVSRVRLAPANRGQAASAL